MNSPLAAAGLVVLAIVFLILGVLYFEGDIQFLTSRGTGHHTTHLVLFTILAVLSLVGANFVRPKQSA